jgi:hypothetical protein
MYARDSKSGGAAWQLILADLALILFMLAAAALSGDAEEAAEPAPARASADVPAQALYRPGPAGRSIARWLEQQQPDPRMSLTIVATHRAGATKEALDEADRLAQAARGAGVSARIILREGTAPDLYASLGYDRIN